MHNRYEIIGIHCKTCIDKITNAISKVGKYSLIPIKEDTIPLSSNLSNDNANWFKVYYPLLLIIGFIIIVTTFTSSNSAVFFDSWMNTFMASFFIAFSFFKLLDIKGFAKSYSTYDILAIRWQLYAYIYPFLELILGLLYLTKFMPLYTNILTILLMGFSSIGVIKAVMNKKKIQCVCFGTIFNLPMSTITIVEDLGMIIMALISAIMVLY
ncbi:MAG: hypothetical protein DMENIID0002_09530 [Rickettsia endosymbiont of Sergentomyia squamirostris]|uniref:Methylamine utilization protein MauE n=1 Tax=Candidatus Tisiphia endosymbiont of Sergentomyia squamirostris TaxID=3113639 RepID=A0AAT9G942_9RICK